MVSIQERFLIKSGLWWRAYGIQNILLVKRSWEMCWLRAILKILGKTVEFVKIKGGFWVKNWKFGHGFFFSYKFQGPIYFLVFCHCHSHNDFSNVYLLVQSYRINIAKALWLWLWREKTRYMSPPLYSVQKFLSRALIQKKEEGPVRLGHSIS